MTKETIYVSWGGTGRGASVRAAVSRAGAAGQNLRYLAILDTRMFGDLTPKQAETVREELTWLLTAQLRMIDLQTDEEVKATIDIREGEITDNVTQLAKEIDADLILLGAPLGRDYHRPDRRTRTELVEFLRQETGADVEVIGDDAALVR